MPASDFRPSSVELRSLLKSSLLGTFPQGCAAMCIVGCLALEEEDDWEKEFTWGDLRLWVARYAQSQLHASYHFVLTEHRDPQFYLRNAVNELIALGYINVRLREGIAYLSVTASLVTTLEQGAPRRRDQA